MEICSAQTSSREATRKIWDVIVIGGGPAGALAARQASLSGLHTLLIEAKSFPRDKVCGGYVNQRALRLLRQVGLEHAAADTSESYVDSIEVICGKERARFPLPPGRAICRSAFDNVLLESAKLSGVSLLLETQAVVEPADGEPLRTVAMIRHGVRDRVQARVVLCADGLSRSSVRGLLEFSSVKAAHSHVGIGAVLTDDVAACPAGQVTMIVARYGYVGIARIDSRRMNIAAAIEPKLLSESGPGNIVAAMLEEADVHVPGALSRAHWRGTPALTAQPLYVASERIFLIGDAAGYVEPFTGEGISTALETAVAIVPLLGQASQSWNPTMAVCWDELHRQIVGDRHAASRQLAWLLRRRWLARSALKVCRLLPNVPARIVAQTLRSSFIETPGTYGAT